MGIFDMLKRRKRNEQKNVDHPGLKTEAPKRITSTTAPSVTVLEPRGKRTWLYVAEYGKLGSLKGDVKGNMNLNVENSIHSSAAPYFQKVLAKIDADTIEVRAIDQHRAILPNDWTYISDDQYALVINGNVAISLIYKDRLHEAGYSSGSTLRCAISHPPYTGGYIIPYVLPSEESLAKLDAIREKRYLEKVSNRSGMHVTDREKLVTLSIVEEKWLGGTYPKSNRSFKPSFEMLKPAEGSKAKPHILIKDGETTLMEISARNGKAYKTISENIEHDCEGRIAYDYWERGDDMVTLLIAFE